MAADTPSGFTSGQVTVAAGSVQDLGRLVQTQFDPNAALAAFLVSIQADSANTGPVFFGMDNTLAANRYGYSLAAGAVRQYGGGTGNVILWGRWKVFSAAIAVLHIEVVA